VSAGGWKRLSERLARLEDRGGKVLIGLDFDGTLAEIATAPARAVLSPETRALLDALQRRPDTRIAVLSGRSLRDVKDHVRMSGIYYAGNHGLEIEGPGIDWTHPRAVPMERAVVESLEAELRSFPGAAVERKVFGLAVHHRRMPGRHLSRLRQRVSARLRGLKDAFRILRGKKTFDLRSTVAWDKGDALDHIRRSLPGGWQALYVGDDATDEEAFRTLGPRALTVRVGRVKRSSAEYVIAHRRLVDRMLSALALRPRRP
jgi:trehalose 6-phosphate phosphatase